MTLLELRAAGVRPARHRSFWPEVEGPVAETLHAARPCEKHIAATDEALGWIGLIPEEQHKLRKLVGARALTNPRTEKPVFSWKTLGDQLGLSEVTAKTWWTAGIGMIVDQLNQPLFCEAPALRGSRQAAAAALRGAGHAARHEARQTYLV
jgi:hypothetical protein